MGEAILYQQKNQVKNMVGSGEIFSPSGILKILEITFAFIIVIIHRFGDYGHMIFFGTSASQMTPNDPGTDEEILGNGACVAYIVIPSVLLISYIIDGRWEVQRFFLEWLWNFIGCLLFLGTGIVSAITWTAAQSDDSGNSTGEKAINYEAALTMSAFCILNSIVYFIDFLFAKRARNMYLAEEAERW